MRRPIVSVSFILALGSAVAGAQPAAFSAGSPQAVSVPSPVPAGAFGGDVQVHVIPITDFVPAQSGYAFQAAYGSYLVASTPVPQSWFAPLGLPPGAAIEEIRVLVQDDDAAEDIRARLAGHARAIDGSGDCDLAFFLSFWNETSAGISGHGVIVLQDDEPFLVRSQAFFPPGVCTTENYLWFSIDLELRSSSQAVSGVAVRWRRTVTPAPVVATFGDVPTSHTFFQFVEALAASGITAGCGGGNFCPDNPLTRGQMAVFLAKALGLHWPS
jgi:hypothetical protein